MELLERLKQSTQKYNWITFEDSDFQLYARSLTSRELEILVKKYPDKKKSLDIKKSRPEVLALCIKDWKGLTPHFIRESLNIDLEPEPNEDPEKPYTFEVSNGQPSKSIDTLIALCDLNLKLSGFVAQATVNINELKTEEEEKKT